MTKYYCDICGEEIEAAKMYGLQIQPKDYFEKFFTFESIEMDICKDCASKISKYVKEMKHDKRREV